jgi:radical SAM superfamily enzyme YgiQ (UPF0313 family)
MQKIINKTISRQEMLNGVSNAYEEGWEGVKVYFIIGLPGQDEEDYNAMIEMLYELSHLRKKVHRAAGWVTATISNFVPKSHTPFQWAPMQSPQALSRIQRKIKEAIRSPKIQVNCHDARLSTLEGLIARGDRRLSSVIVDAWRAGAYLDGWQEHYKPSLWEKALEQNKILKDFYLYREIPQGEKLPWYHLSCSVSVDFLWQEWQKAQKGAETANCMEGKCNLCGINPKSCFRQG